MSNYTRTSSDGSQTPFPVLQMYLSEGRKAAQAVLKPEDYTIEVAVEYRCTYYEQDRDCLVSQCGML